MRIADVIAIALGALARHKMRTFLSLLGVVIGTFLLVTSLSLGEGVRHEVERQFTAGNQLRQIYVRPDYDAQEKDIPPRELDFKGQMGDDRRRRLRKAVIARWPRQQRRPKVPLDPKRLADLKRLPHVVSVRPTIYANCQSLYDDRIHKVLASTAAIDDDLKRRIVAGECFPSDDAQAVLVHEYLVYRWGLVDEGQVENVIGRRMRLEYRPRGEALAGVLQAQSGGKVELSPQESRTLDETIRRLPELADQIDLTPEQRAVLKKALRTGKPKSSASRPPAMTAQFTIAGVIRDATELEEKQTSRRFDDVGASVDVVLPLETALHLAMQNPQQAEYGLNSATLIVDHEDHVEEVVGRVKQMGLREFSLLEIVRRVRKHITLVISVLSVLALVALIVSALGITNTMIMNVLERTQEIGVMKAVGARNRHILLIFLTEGVLIGVIGGAIGVTLGWLASYPGDAYFQATLAGKTRSTLGDTLFLFPLWLTLGVPAASGLVTMLAALYPARRAVRIDPIQALRRD